MHRALIPYAHAAIKMIAIVVLFCPLWLAAQGVPVQRVGAGVLEVSAALAVLEDAGGRMTLPEAVAADRAGAFALRPGAADGLALGFTASAFWLRLEIRNPGPDTVRQLLELANPRISRVTLYQPDAAGAYTATHTGGDLPFASRPFANRQLVFPLTLGPQATQVLYLRVQSSIGLIVPARLWAEPDFWGNMVEDYTLQAWYFGMAAAMLLFNLMLWLALQDRVYAYYVAFGSGMAMTVATKTGLAGQYLWPEPLVWGNFSYFSAASLTLAAFCLFTRRMLNTVVVAPRIHRALLVLAVLHGVAPLVYYGALAKVASLAVVFFMFSGVFLGAVALHCAWQRQRMAYFYLGAFGILMLSGLVTTARSFGWLPTNVLTVNGFQWGSCLEMFMLAFALADRYTQVRREKNLAQQALGAAQMQLVDTLRASEQELSRRVEERTHALEAANARLEALSMVDGLTGIANRRHFDQVLHKEWARLERAGQPLALVMLDVDWFKRYNDHFGHQAGDECLRAVAQAISGVSRASDLVARYGGEEFVIIAPATDGPQAAHMAQRACEAVRALGLPHPLAYESVVTVSCGVAVTVPGPEDTLENLLGQADDALYEAKAQGRNRVVLAQPLDPKGDVPAK